MSQRRHIHCVCHLLSIGHSPRLRWIDASSIKSGATNCILTARFMWPWWGPIRRGKGVWVTSSIPKYKIGPQRCFIPCNNLQFCRARRALPALYGNLHCMITWDFLKPEWKGKCHGGDVEMIEIYYMEWHGFVCTERVNCTIENFPNDSLPSFAPRYKRCHRW